MNTALNPLLLSVADVEVRLGCSRATVYRWIKLGGFPEPLKIGAKTKFYTVEIDKWIRSSRRGLPPEPDRLRRARCS